MGDAIADLVDDAAVPIAMVGLLYALPETGLSRRLATEGRLHSALTTDATLSGSADQCTQGLNFDTARPRREILEDFRTAVARTYEPARYHARVRKMAGLLRFDHAVIDVMRSGMVKNVLFAVRLSWAMGIAAKEGRRLYWGTLWHAFRHDSRSLEAVFLALAGYAHVGPFSRQVVTTIDRMILETPAPRAALIAAE